MDEQSLNKKESRDKSGNCRKGLLLKALWMFTKASLKQGDHLIIVLVAGSAINSVKQATNSAYLGMNGLKTYEIKQRSNLCFLSCVPLSTLSLTVTKVPA